MFSSVLSNDEWTNAKRKRHKSQWKAGQYNDTWYNDTQHSGSEHDKLYCDTVHNDSIITIACNYAEYQICHAVSLC
jgi:hypothetical protein